MRISPRRVLAANHLERRVTALTMLIILAGLLDVAAAVGLAYVAGFSSVRAALAHFQWPWLIPLFGALAISFVGYYHAYRGIFRAEGGPRLSRRQMRAVVAAGFGGFLVHGGSVLDQYALESAGAGKDDAKVRVTGLGGLEHGVLSIFGTAAGITVLASGLTSPPADFTVPWAVVPVPGFLIAFWLAERYRERFTGQQGWQGAVGTFLDSIHIIREMFRHPARYWWALAGMALFWAADAFAAWSGLAAFGFHMNAAPFFIGFATGMVFTRRTGPLGGAGILGLVLPLTIWYSGAPFAVAIAGVFAYRVASLWLPLPFSLAALPTLRQMGRRQVPRAEGTAEAPREPGLQGRG